MSSRTVELPAVEPESGGGVHEVLDVKEELIFRFLDVMWSIEEDTDLSKGNDRHHECIVPQLVFVHRDVCH